MKGASAPHDIEEPWVEYDDLPLESKCKFQVSQITAFIRKPLLQSEVHKILLSIFFAGHENDGSMAGGSEE